MEQVRLVVEMPVDGSTSHAGLAGYLFQGGVRDALGEEQLFGGGEYAAPGFLCVLFGSSHIG